MQGPYNNAHLHIFVTKWCIVVYSTDALRDLCDRSTIGLPEPNSVINLNFQLNQSKRFTEFGQVVYDTLAVSVLTLWGRVAQICVTKLDTIG